MFAKMYCAFIGIAIITCFFNYGFVLVEGCIFALILTFMSESGKTGKKTTRDVKKENKYDDAWSIGWESQLSVLAINCQKGSVRPPNLGKTASMMRMPQP